MFFEAVIEVRQIFKTGFIGNVGDRRGVLFEKFRGILQAHCTYKFTGRFICQLFNFAIQLDAGDM